MQIASIFFSIRVLIIPYEIPVFTFKKTWPICTKVVLTKKFYTLLSHLMKKEFISTKTEPSDLFLDTVSVKALKTIFGNNFEKE